MVKRNVKRNIFIIMGIPISFYVAIIGLTANSLYEILTYYALMYAGAWLLEFNYLLGFIKPYKSNEMEVK